MSKRQNEIEELRKDIDNVNYRNNWAYGFLCIAILLFFAIMFLTFDNICNKLKDLPHKVCENVAEWNIDNTCREKGDIIYNTNVDCPTCEEYFDFEAQQIRKENDKLEARSCIHNNIATIYIKQDNANLIINVEDSIKYLKNDKTGEIYNAVNGIISLGYVEPNSALVLVNVSQDLSDYLDQFYPQFTYCSNGIKKLYDTDDSSFKIVECKIE